MRKVLKWGSIGCGGLIALIIVVIIIAAMSGGGGNGEKAEVDPTVVALDWNTLKDTAERVPYEDLFRNNEEWEGNSVYYEGKIVQVIEGSGDKYQLRANVTKGEIFWDDTVFLRYSGERLLEDDTIEFVGRVNGLIKYEAIFGNEVTIPDITIIQSRRIP